MTGALLLCNNKSGERKREGDIEWPQSGDQHENYCSPFGSSFKWGECWLEKEGSIYLIRMQKVRCFREEEKAQMEMASSVTTAAAEVLVYYSEETYFKSILQERVRLVSPQHHNQRLDRYLSTHCISSTDSPSFLIAFTAWSLQWTNCCRLRYRRLWMTQRMACNERVFKIEGPIKRIKHRLWTQINSFTVHYHLIWAGHNKRWHWRMWIVFVERVAFKC